MRLTSFCAISLLFAAGCQALLVLDPSEDARGEGGADATSETTSSDAPASETTRDARPALDGGPDACLFCTSFDEPNGALEEWTRPEKSQGTVELSASEVSAPNALHAHVNPRAVGGYARLVKDLGRPIAPTGSARLTVRATGALKCNVGAADEVLTFGIDIVPPTALDAYGGITIVCRANDLVLESLASSGGVGGGRSPGQIVHGGAWKNFVLDLSVSRVGGPNAGGNIAQLTIDGQKLIVPMPAIVPALELREYTLNLIAGVNYANAGDDPIDVQMDDIAVYLIEE